MVLVILRMFRTALRRFTIARALAMGVIYSRSDPFGKMSRLHMSRLHTPVSERTRDEPDRARKDVTDREEIRAFASTLRARRERGGTGHLELGAYLEGGGFIPDSATPGRSAGPWRLSGGRGTSSG